MTSPKWRQEGTDPDYRFSLANERTFLAWVRTGLALLAGALVLDQMIGQHNPHPLVKVIALLLVGIAAAICVGAYVRWRANEEAMRLQQTLPHSRMIIFLSTTITLVALTTVVLVMI